MVTDLVENKSIDGVIMGIWVKSEGGLEAEKMSDLMARELTIDEGRVIWGLVVQNRSIFSNFQQKEGKYYNWG